MVVEGFLEGFWDSGASKVGVWFGGGAILQGFTYFSKLSFWERSWDDFELFWEFFWETTCCQKGFKNRLKKLWIFGAPLEALWAAKGGPRRSGPRGRGTTERGRGEVNLSPNWVVEGQSAGLADLPDWGSPGLGVYRIGGSTGLGSAGLGRANP